MIKIVGSFEGQVKDLLREIFTKLKNYEVINTNEEPRKIPNPSSKSHFCLNYKPDFCVKNKRSKYEIFFEILDTQSEEKTIADVVRCILYKNCVKAIFITKDARTASQTKETIDAVYRGIKILGKNKNKMLDIFTTEADFTVFGRDIIRKEIETLILTPK